MSDPAPVFVYLKQKVLRPVELQLIGKNREGNFSIQRSCGSNRNLDSYHMSVPQLRQCGSGDINAPRIRNRPYSIRLARDRAVIGTDGERYAVGLDISFPPKRLQAFSRALMELVQSDAPFTRDVCEVVYSPDGKNVYGWWAGNGRDSAPQLGYGDNSHLYHTHISQHRDAAEVIPATAELVIRALHRGGLITEEQMDGYLEPFKPEEPVTKEEVKALQASINECGYQPPLLVDGIYGPMTHAAVLALPQLMNERVTAASLVTRDQTKEAAVAAVEAI